MRIARCPSILVIGSIVTVVDMKVLLECGRMVLKKFFFSDWPDLYWSILPLYNRQTNVKFISHYFNSIGIFIFQATSGLVLTSATSLSLDKGGLCQGTLQCINLNGRNINLSRLLKNPLNYQESPQNTWRQDRRGKMFWEFSPLPCCSI